MKRPKDDLDRLFRGAARSCDRAHANGPDRPSPELEARILASLPGRRTPAEDPLAALLPVVRRAAMLAALAALVTVLICLRGDHSPIPTADSWVIESVSELTFLP